MTERGNSAPSGASFAERVNLLEHQIEYPAWVNGAPARFVSINHEAALQILACIREQQAALAEYVAAADGCVTDEDSVRAMLRYGKADEAARATLAKWSLP